MKKSEQQKIEKVGDEESRVKMERDKQEYAQRDNMKMTAYRKQCQAQFEVNKGLKESQQ